MVDPSSFARLVPGFDFLQGLAKNAGAAVPGIGQWVAPTLNPEELDKRIGELRTVQFWLEQNARLLGTTIQALEVQRMTLSTLKTMNVQLSDLRDALTIPLPKTPATPVEAAAEPAAAPAEAAKLTPPAGVDPMQWWSALTQQFTELASAAMNEGAAGVAQHVAAATAPAAPRKAATGPAAKAGKAAPPRKPASRAG